MKKIILLLKYELIRVHTILHMILGIQKQRHVWCGNEGGRAANPGSLVWNLIPGFEFIKAALRREGGKIERSPNSPPQYFGAVSLAAFFYLYSHFHMPPKVRSSMRKAVSKVLTIKLFTVTKIFQKEMSNEN